MTASVGNLNASDLPSDRLKLERVFYNTFFLDFWIYGFSACCLLVLFNPFISIWLGESLLFDNFTVLIIVINFYLTGMRKAVLTFWEATATFYYDRYKPPFEIAINLVTSVFLAARLGAAGVFLGTIISTVTTCFWIEPYVLYKHVFNKNSKQYFIRWAFYTAVVVIAALVTCLIAMHTYIENAYLLFIVKMLICLTIPNVIFWLFFHNSAEFSFFCNLCERVVSKFLTKFRN